MKKSNLILYVTAFLCGMSVMAVELSCSRLLAPYFSSSSIVWTIIIGLIMISLSIGNILGGRSADKHKDLDKLYFRIWIASLWIAAIPFIGKYVIAGVTGLMMLLLPGSALVTVGSALSCLVIFSFPMILLGMVTPYLVKLAISDLDTNGRVTGQIYAMSTIGSIVGTFIPTFLTIPFIGTGKTFFLFALLLNALCLYRFLTRKKRPVKNIVATALLVVLLFTPFHDAYAFWKDNVVFEGESLYNYIQVTEDAESVVLSTNVAFGVQSVYMKDGSLSGFYYEYAMMAPFFQKDTRLDGSPEVLVLGLGTGTFPKQMKKYFPGTHTDAVEIDAKIAELAKSHFALADDEADIFINDGRSFLNTPDCGQYDIILADAYQDITVPFHMSTVEFFQSVRSHLKPGGVLIINVNMKSGDFDGVPEYLSQTVRSVFSKVYRVDLDQVTNSLLFCSDSEDMLAQYDANIEANLPESHELHTIATRVREKALEIQPFVNSRLVLTDDLAPVEILSQRSLNKIVENEISWVKGALANNEDGLKGLLELLK